MQKKNKSLQLAIVVCLAVSAVVLFVSCGGSKNGGSNTSTTVTYTSASQAASGASSAKAAADLSSVMSAAASDLSSSSNPSGYAPGKGGTASVPDTSSLANIDPRLQELFDGMLAQMKSMAIKNAVTNVRTKATLASVPTGTTVTISGTCSGATGSFSVTGTDTSSAGTYTEYTVDISFTSCKDVDSTTDYTALDGTIHAYDKRMTDYSSATRNATVNLTGTTYVAGTLSKTDVANGTFNGSDASTASGRSGMDSADGSFSETTASTGQVGTFYFTNLTNNWTTNAATNTRVDTMNGSFGISITSTGGSLKLDVSLANLENKVRSNGDGSRDQWVNGSITITWTPDLSTYGCIGGKINFTTADATPLHFINIFATCPSSGTLQVNNATIVYGSPITVTVGTDTQTFPNCSSMKKGMCG